MESSLYSNINIVAAGETGVGKTSLIERFTKNIFNEEMKSTIGLDFYRQVVTVDELELNLKFWDTAGQEKYHAIANNFFQKAHGVLLVYDVTSRASFMSLEKWVENIKSHAPKEAKFILIGNKTDKIDSREVSAEEGRAFAESSSFFFAETSAKENDDQNVQRAFNVILREMSLMVRRQIEEERKESGVNARNELVSIEERDRKGRWCC